MLAHLVLILLLSMHRVAQLILRGASPDAGNVLAGVLQVRFARLLLVLRVSVHNPCDLGIVLTVHDRWLVHLLQSCLSS